VDAGVRHQIGLEFSDVHIQRTVEPQRRRQRGNHLGDEAVEVGVCRAFKVQAATADVIDGLVVQHHRYIGVLQEGVG